MTSPADKTPSTTFFQDWQHTWNVAGYDDAKPKSGQIGRMCGNCVAGLFRVVTGFIIWGEWAVAAYVAYNRYSKHLNEGSSAHEAAGKTSQIAQNKGIVLSDLDRTVLTMQLCMRLDDKTAVNDLILVKTDYYKINEITTAKDDTDVSGLSQAEYYKKLGKYIKMPGSNLLEFSINQKMYKLEGVEDNWKVLIQQAKRGLTLRQGQNTTKIGNNTYSIEISPNSEPIKNPTLDIASGTLKVPKEDSLYTFTKVPQ